MTSFICIVSKENNSLALISPFEGQFLSKETNIHLYAVHQVPTCVFPTNTA